MALGLLGMPEVLAEYKALGAAIVARDQAIDSEAAAATAAATAAAV